MSPFLSVLHSWGSQCSLTCSPFPHRIHQRLKKIFPGPLLCCLGWSDVGKVKLFLLPISVCPNSFFFSSAVCWNFSSGNLDFHKVSLICGWLSKTMFFMESQTVAKKDWSRSMGHCRVHSQDLSLYTYCSIHMWVRLLLGLLLYGAWSHSFNKGTFVCG